MPLDNLTTALAALRALIDRDAAVDTARELSSAKMLELAPQMLAVIEAAAEVRELWEADSICASDKFKGKLDAAIDKQRTALDALAAVLGMAEFWLAWNGKKLIFKKKEADAKR